MTEQEYRKLRLKDVEGRTVRTLFPMSAGRYTIPAGTVATITGKRDGWQIKTAACSECGIQVEMRNVAPRNVELMLSETPIGRESPPSRQRGSAGARCP